MQGLVPGFYNDAEKEKFDNYFTKPKERGRRNRPKKLRRGYPKKKQTTGDTEDAWVGARVRKCFGEHGIYDGEVVGSDLVDGRTVWRVLYSDGDREDLDDEELLDILVVDLN